MAGSIAKALEGYKGEAEAEGHGGEDADVYVSDLAKALGVSKDKAREVYDIFCAIIEAKGAGAVSITVG